MSDSGSNRLQAIVSDVLGRVEWRATGSACRVASHGAEFDRQLLLGDGFDILDCGVVSFVFDPVDGAVGFILDLLDGVSLVLEVSVIVCFVPADELAALVGFHAVPAAHVESLR